MPTVLEYRVMMPLSLEEFQRARQWHKNEQMKLEIKLLQNESISVTDFGERILLRELTRDVSSFSTEPVIPEEIQAEHLIKGYGSASQCSVPVPVSFFAAAGSLVDISFTDNIQLTQVESWEAYPFFRSVSSNNSIGPRYRMTIEGTSISGNVTAADNPLNLPESLLKMRKVIVVDIAENVAGEDYRDGKDPRLYISKKTGRGPLEPGKWMEELQPCLTCCILVNVQFDFLGPLGSYAERKLHKGIRRAMILHHREVFCCLDEWIDLSISELQQAGKELHAELEEAVATKVKTNGNVVSGTVQTATLAEPPMQNDGTKNTVVRACPMDGIKTWVEGIWSGNSAGGSVGYSFLKVGLILSIVALLIAVFLMKYFFSCSSWI